MVSTASEHIPNQKVLNPHLPIVKNPATYEDFSPALQPAGRIRHCPNDSSAYTSIDSYNTVHLP